MRQELDATKEHLRAKDEVAAKLETRVRELSAEKGQLEVDVLPARVEAERLRKELEASKARLGAAEAEVDRKIDELAEERKKGGGMRLELQGKLGQAEAEAATLRERLAGAEGQLRSREGALELKEQELLAAQKHLTEVGWVWVWVGDVRGDGVCLYGDRSTQRPRPAQRNRRWRTASTRSWRRSARWRGCTRSRRRRRRARCSGCCRRWRASARRTRTRRAAPRSARRRSGSGSRGSWRTRRRWEMGRALVGVWVLI